jgi:tRNA dimethylallyltransferase
MKVNSEMITILGPTASGKTVLAATVAERIDAEIISADSRQVYRRMNLGTGKDLDDYDIGSHHIPYHLIDIVEPGTKYNVFEYQRDFLKAYEDIVSRNVTPILCGGTGLYIEAVLKGYRLIPVPDNPELRESLSGKSLRELTDLLADLKAKNHSTMHNVTDVDTVKRAIRAIEIEYFYMHTPVSAREFPKIDSIIIGLDIRRELRREKITNRLRERLNNGMVDEVKGLIEEGISPDNLIYYGLEYKFITEYVLGKISYEEMFERLQIAIHQFAQRQMTWFRGMEKRGFHINWIDAELPLEEKTEQILRLIG